MNEIKSQLISSEGAFSLWSVSPIYKSYSITKGGYIKNTKTNENCGNYVQLRKHYYQNGVALDEPVYDEDCYEYVFEEVNENE